MRNHIQLEHSSDYCQMMVVMTRLLAVTAQMMLILAQEKVGRGANYIELDELFSPLANNGISPDECNEALDHLLITGQIHEVDDDCFVPEE